MKALVVYESMFGNTARIAEEVADGLNGAMTVDLVEVGAAPTSLEGVDLVAVGCPTHAFGLSRPGTRADAERKGAEAAHAAGPGLRDWLEAVGPGRPGLPAAAFDTRIDRPRVPGSAAKGAVRRLRQLGCHVVLPAQSFFVADTAGPLVSGEEERARRWAEAVLSHTGAVGASPAR